MSFTLTYTPEKRATNSIIHLSPSKRRRATTPPASSSNRPEHSVADIYSWTLRADATAPCCIRDVMSLLKNEIDTYDFYWLGHVPCRIVKLVGLVVGIQIYEKKILYTIDDGTGVVDCMHSQVKPKVKRQNPTSKYQPLVEDEPAPPPEPIAEIGQSVEVVGRVKPYHDSWQIVLSQIDICSPNNELLHTRAVRKLHKTLFSRTDAFVIPPPHEPLYSLPVRRPIVNVPKFSLSSPISSVSSSPVKAAPVCSSPAKPAVTQITTIKLRHPSRLHTHDLTENTFRIYVKHYMDCTQEPQRFRNDSKAAILDSIPQIPSTSTKRPRSDETPRQASRPDSESTPRARIPAPKFTSEDIDSSPLDDPFALQMPIPIRRGFALSYLRRVPELALLATRVTEAVSRRYLQAERQKLRDAGLLKKGKPLPASYALSKKRLRTKQLFQRTIVKMFEEGAMALWDGPVYLCPNTSLMNISRLWKSNTSASTACGDSTIFSTTTNSMPSFRRDDGDDDEELSDPEPDEEAYIALTPEYLANYVEGAIMVLVNHYQTIGKPYLGATRDGILSVLRKDDRWQHLGTWTIDEALQYMKSESRVWDLGNGRWDLTM